MTPYVLFYVENPTTSAKAIQTLLGAAPVETSPAFVLFVIDGVRLGLWRTADVRPLSQPAGENGEISLEVETREAVNRHHAEWQDHALPILQAPEDKDFGYTATVGLPGPLRLRVFHPGAMQG
ncbi:drug:proton antiporter [Aureimonas sp. SK2]|uniref:drug:proton antiporter n=1 Tax=Aureimonas sp. SK2 TaxID=3015992 RepID=UPI002443C3E3|nr:drug:proton antiporter [Aureimonas sp. SK2]